LRDLKLSSDVTTDSPRDFKRMTKTGPETGQKNWRGNSAVTIACSRVSFEPPQS
jgi:hypothetical protein